MLPPLLYLFSLSLLLLVVYRRAGTYRPSIMSFSSVKNLLAQYLPVSDSSRTSFSDVEKDSQLPLSNDVDSTLGFNASNVTQQQQRKSFVDARVISDAIIGLSDGMTVPFALTAGLSTLEDTRVVVFGGLAELIAGAISMGLGGYLGAKSEECVSVQCY